MAMKDEIVIAEITEVVKELCGPESPSGRANYSLGYVIVSCSWGHQTLMDRSIQGIPPEHREVGKRVKLRWNAAGAYNGPVFAGTP